jgi:oligopeptide/dipeptide ABC transporter ATP-binding protein
VNIEMNDPENLIEVRDLKTYFFLREGVVRAVEGATFNIQKGKTLGVVGESGCGKSVTAQSILQIVPKPGRIVFGEIILNLAKQGEPATPIKITDLSPSSSQMRQLRGSVMGLIFQEPMSSFSPVHTIGDQLSETILLHQGISKQSAKDTTLQMMREVGIPHPERLYDAYPYQLSGGMRQRSMIAMALMLRPNLLIADEPTTALDVTTQAQTLDLMRQLQSQIGMAIMFITHDLGVIAEMADDVVVMYLGRMVEYASVDEIFYDPKHPYLQALLRSIPRLGKRTGKRLPAIEGMVPNPSNIPAGCPFHPRCKDAIPNLCDTTSPPQTYINPRHIVECHLYPSDANRR